MMDLKPKIYVNDVASKTSIFESKDNFRISIFTLSVYQVTIDS